jgi:hypothetical protein
MTTLQDLLARVESATESGVDLFLSVGVALLPDTFPCTIDHNHERVQWKVRWTGWLGEGAFTEAALALVERVLPGWRWMVRRIEPSEFPSFGAYVEQVDGEHFWRTGSTPALAILSALLKALIAQEAQPA